MLDTAGVQPPSLRDVVAEEVDGMATVLELIAELDDLERRAMISYECFARSFNREHWVDAGAQHAPYMLRLRDLGLVELYFDTREQWAKARLTVVGRQVGSALLGK